MSSQIRCSPLSISIKTFLDDIDVDVFDLDFDNDIALLEEIISRAQESAFYISAQKNRFFTRVQLQKDRKFLQPRIFKYKRGNSHPLIHRFNGQHIELVNHFKYLGSMVVSNETDIRVRNDQAWCAFWKMKYIFRSMNITICLETGIRQASYLSY